MRNRQGLRISIGVLTVASMFALPVVAGGVTVGDFVRNMASAMTLPAQDEVTAEGSLRAAGFPLPPLDRSAALTEGAVAAISNAVGLRITSSNPAASFEQERLDRFITSMAPQLNAARVGGVDARGASTESSRSHSGRGKKKPHSKSPKKPKHPRSRRDH